MAHWRESGKARQSSEAGRFSRSLESFLRESLQSLEVPGEARRPESSRTTPYESNVCFSIRSKAAVSRLRIGLSLSGEVAAATKKDRFV